MLLPPILVRVLRLLFFIQMQAYKATILLTCCPASNDINNWLIEGIKAPWSYQVTMGERILVGPYSPVWYVLYQPARFGIFTLFIYLLLVDSLVTGFLFKKTGAIFLGFYTISSMYFWLVDPVDLWVFWFALLGNIHWLFSIVALTTKLPVGAPMYVWDYVLHNPYGINENQGWNRYFQLAGWWTVGLLTRRQKLNMLACRHFFITLPKITMKQFESFVKIIRVHPTLSEAEKKRKIKARAKDL